LKLGALFCLLVLSLIFAESIDADAIPVEDDSIQAVLSEASPADSIEILMDLGRASFKHESYNSALEHFYKALIISERINSNQDIAKITNNIAAIYYQIDSLQRAMKYFRRSIQVEEEIGNEAGISKSLNNIAIILNEMGQYDEAISYYDSALGIKTRLGDREGEGTTLSNMGLVYIQTGDYQQALKHYEQAMEIFVKIGDDWSIANAYGNMARAHLLMDNYDNALSLVDKSHVIAKEINSPNLQKDNLLTFFNIYSETNQYKKAFEYSQAYHHLKDSLRSLEVSENLNEVRTRYETLRKEKENALLREERESQQATIRLQTYLTISALVVVVLLVILAISMHKNNREKARAYNVLEKQNEEIEAQRKELEELNQIKNKIFSIISHEVRSPLNSLLGTVSLLNSGVLSSEEFFKLSSDLKSKVSHTTNFLNNLLVWAKSQMQGIHVEPGVFNVNELINETVHLMKEQADMKGIDVKLDFDNGLLANADRNMVGIVIKNLITNAIKFTSRKQKITISTSDYDNDFVKIAVSDEGVGIPEETKKKLFSYDSISTKGTAQEVGTGLGLVLSKSLIEENRGKIWVESEEGKGSTFFFTIPRHKG